MSTETQVASEVDEAPEALTPVEEPKRITELTSREIAIIEGRDPDKAPETPEPEAVETSTEEVAQEPQEPGAKSTEPEVWFTDADREFAKGYGLTEYELQGFKDRDSFKAAVSLLDRAAARKPAEPEKAEPEAKTEEYVDEPIVGDRINVEYLRRNGYDETTIKLLQFQQEKLDSALSRQAEYEQREQEAVNQQILEGFHQAADKLNAELFGSRFDQKGNYVAPTKKQLDNRERLLEEAEILADAIQRRGQQLPSWQELLNRAQWSAFEKDLIAQREKQQEQSNRERLSRVAKQQRDIRPVGVAVTPRNRVAAKNDDPVKALMANPEMQAFWDRVTEENGTI